MRRATLALLTGLAVAVGTPTAFLLTTDPDPEPFGGAAAQELADEQQVGPRPVVPGPAARTVGTRSARLGDLVPDRPAVPDQPAVPVQVTVGGKVVAVDPVGLDADRQVVVPDDVRRAGWYDRGTRPGQPTGSAVLVGHVDDRTQGLGSFAVLAGLEAGEPVTVRTASGDELRYAVVALEQFGKDDVPISRLFAADGPHRLVLISCGGDFDRTTGHYTDNVVVTAVPLPAEPSVAPRP